MEGLKERIKKRELNDSDFDSLLSLLHLIITLRNLVEKRRLRLLFWLRKIFGLKTEKNLPSPRTTPKGKGGARKKGRYGKNDYPGADKTEVKHPHLCRGDQCPECHQGKLREIEPGVDYDWQGNSPIHLHIYLLQRFICHNCKSYFTAPSPVAESAKTVDDSEDKVKVTKCNRNALANSVVACLRFMFGIPFYRLAKIQSSLGIGLPEANQYAMVAQVYDAAKPVYEQLIFEAAQGSLIMADDTAIKILDWLRGKGPPTRTTGEPRKSAQTSAVVSKSAEGKSIVLYLTGEKQAGRNVEEILNLRTASSGAPIYMCDGLGANLLAEKYSVIQVHCLDHARRQFFDLQSSFPKESTYILEQLGKVYYVDREAKDMNLSPEDRLKYHQLYSAKVLAELGKWMMVGIDTGAIEENGALGSAVKYMIKRWTELNEFLHTPGVPLSNAECERTIKKIITHRKNSLFYKTAKGANVGDVIQSLIATCQEAGVSPFKYLAWLQENKTAVKQAPETFLPWCYSA